MIYAFQQTSMRQHTAEFYINCYVPMGKKNDSSYSLFLSLWGWILNLK